MVGSTEIPHRTLTALYMSSEEADRAIARLRAAGIGAETIRTRGGDATREGKGSDPVGGFFDFLMPDRDRRRYEAGIGRGGILVILDDVPAAMVDAALDVLDEEAVDLHEGWERSDPAGATATLDGS